MPPPDIDVSLIIACYNEEQYLEKNVAEIRRIMDMSVFRYELIFIDDCSRDNTRDIIPRLCEGRNDCRYVFHEHNLGRGGTVTEGIRLAKGTVAGFIDIDLETPATNIPLLVKTVLEGADIATAQRIYKMRWQLIPRWFMTRGYHYLFRKMLQVTLSDTETGCKFFNRERILPILDDCTDTHWFWDTEIMVRPYLKGYKIVEIPTLFIRNPEYNSTVQPLRDSYRQFKALLEFRNELKRKGYLL